MFSRPDPVASVPGPSLYVLWHVNEDMKYDIVRNTSLPRKGAFVAIRTLGGRGRISFAGQDSIEVDAGSLLFLENKKLTHHRTVEANWHFWWFEFSLSGPYPFPLYQRLSVPLLTAETGFLEKAFTFLHSKRRSLLISATRAHFISARTSRSNSASLPHAILRVKLATATSDPKKRTARFRTALAQLFNAGGAICSL